MSMILFFETIGKTGSRWSETVIKKILRKFSFSGEDIKKRVKILSGEKARLAMARMLVEPSHLLLLDEPTNHLDMVSRNVLENALMNYAGSIICISHDRHFLNQITNIICEVGNSTIKIYEGNYEYYEWKSKESLKNITIKKNHTKTENKTNYKNHKKNKTEFNGFLRGIKIDIEIKKLKNIIQDPKNGKDYEKLQDAIEKIGNLEQEYLILIEEEEKLK